MRAYKIERQPLTGTFRVVEFAGSMADAKVARRTLATQLEVAISTVDIVDVDIPTSKGALIEFLNNLVK